ncbi:putative alanine--tRNA ligase KNAG_0H02050 [Huiozyma naganishii CBS 8797]|uniref:Threonyl/alanyl tRNA synthetase SAD domain-containing protein n=1 Tax=Huiozyma naganishii (strain ATCC MYA-139 / BCRC 22969 / CBS 8797 / KCTC 17520 / NBRC 10181 / NCYC 3082 / Yp74L-3) TaxID=1071383 RepID=J7S8L5_HUIN7|nr:hypothetical protein KNAG_0H02050 [Kazachstania naganishii CBS 8797]CCK71619.1 hypothetical protein KNAG_0H02050 [Kazachstania naganishii CBS 8797]
MTIKATIVGALACQRNSFLFDGFRTTVLSCVEDSKTKRDNDKHDYLIELQDTILFPQGGGQPTDTGYLNVLADGDNIKETVKVSSVTRNGLHAIHHVNEYVEPGTAVSVIVDKEKRLDYMQQHTGQHLLSAILEQKPYELKTLSWAMGGIPTAKKPQLEPFDYFNYIEIGRALSPQEIEDITETANNYISINPLPISVFERAPDKHEEVDTSKIPDDYNLERGVLRTIHIGELDSNPCCGTHLNTTGQIESVCILPNQTSVRGTNSRLLFMCGSRVRNFAKTSSDIITSCKTALSCTETAIPDKIAKLKDQLQQSNKREQFWIKELAPIEASRLATCLSKTGKAYISKDAFGSLEFLLQVYKELTPLLETAPSNYQVVLCGREKNQMGSLLIVSDSGDTISAVAKDISGLVKNVKGGGGKKGGKWQGKITNFSDAEWIALLGYLEQTTV